MSAWEANGKSNEWYTPKYIFDALGCRFTLDVAPAPNGNAHVPSDAGLDDGLCDPWFGFVWMNPPFGRRNGLMPWLDRFFRHGNGIALTPDRTSAPWFQIYARKSSAILFVSPKVKFERPDGTTGNSPGSGTALLAAGPRGRAVLFRAGALGLVVQPNEGAADAARDGAVAAQAARSHSPASVRTQERAA